MARGKSGGHPAHNGNTNAKKDAPVPLPVIPESKTGSYGVIAPTFANKPALAGPGGPGSRDFSCGGCGNVLVAGWVGQPQMDNAAMKCGKCSVVNDLAPING